jgi:hypothetical protein
MICACVIPTSRIPNLFAPLAPNLAAAGSPSANAQASGQAALNAAAQSAASSNVALKTALSASSLAKLEALANFTAAMNSAFGIDLRAPGAAAQFGQLLQALLANGFGGAMNGLPFGELPKLLALGSIANGMNSLSAANAAGVLAGTNAGAQLAAGLNASLNAKSSLAAALTGGLTGGASADMAAMLNAQAAVKAGLGVNLGASGSVGALAGMMPTLSSNVGGMPDFSSVASEAVLAKALQMLSALEAIKAAFGVDLLQPGAGPALNAALNKNLNANLGKDLSGGKDLSKSADASLNKSANAGLGGQLQEQADAMHNENLEKVANSAPAVPAVPSLLAAVLGKLMSHLGLDVVQHQPCGKKCLFAAPGMFMPTGCLCPSAGKK